MADAGPTPCALSRMSSRLRSALRPCLLCNHFRASGYLCLVCVFTVEYLVCISCCIRAIDPGCCFVRIKLMSRAHPTALDMKSSPADWGLNVFHVLRNICRYPSNQAKSARRTCHASTMEIPSTSAPGGLAQLTVCRGCIQYRTACPEAVGGYVALGHAI